MKCLSCQTLNPDFAVYCQQCNAYIATDSRRDYADTFKALLLSLIGTSLFYLILPGTTNNEYLQQLFSGHIAEAIMGLSIWSLFMLLYKYRLHRRQTKAYQAFRNQSIHQIVSQGIYVKDVQQKAEEISRLLQSLGIRHFQDSFIFRRVRRVLYYIQAIPKKEEINKILNYQAEIDFNRMENGYSLLNVFIWAIPILGFIGTVFGIGEAIGEFSEFIRAVNAVTLGGQMRSALGGVTSGLSLAFNTTFLALICVIPIMMISSFLHKIEEDLLLLIEEYCLEELLPNLHVHPGGETPTESLDEHLHRLMQFSESWISKISPLLDSVTNYAETLKHQIEGLHPLVKDFSNTFFNAKDTLIGEKDMGLNSTSEEGEESVSISETSVKNSQ